MRQGALPPGMGQPGVKLAPHGTGQYLVAEPRCPQTLYIETPTPGSSFHLDAKTASLKKTFLGKAGGTIGRKYGQHRGQGRRYHADNCGRATGSVWSDKRCREIDTLRLLSGIYEPTRGRTDRRPRRTGFRPGVGMDPRSPATRTSSSAVCSWPDLQADTLLSTRSLSSPNWATTCHAAARTHRPACGCDSPWVGDPASTRRSCCSTRGIGAVDAEF